MYIQHESVKILKRVTILKTKTKLYLRLEDTSRVAFLLTVVNLLSSSWFHRLQTNALVYRTLLVYLGHSIEFDIYLRSSVLTVRWLRPRFRKEIIA